MKMISGSDGRGGGRGGRKNRWTMIGGNHRGDGDCGSTNDG